MARCRLLNGTVLGLRLMMFHWSTRTRTSTEKNGDWDGATESKLPAILQQDAHISYLNLLWVASDKGLFFRLLLHIYLFAFGVSLNLNSWQSVCMRWENSPQCTMWTVFCDSLKMKQNKQSVKQKWKYGRTQRRYRCRIHIPPVLLYQDWSSRGTYQC